MTYHGIGSLLSGNQILNTVNNIVMNNLQCGNSGQGYKDSYDAFHQGEKVGEGVYVNK